MNAFTAKKDFFLRSRKGLVILLVLLLLLVIGLWRLLFTSDRDAITYATGTVVRGDIENLVTATGNLQPRDYVDVGAQVSGQLEKLHVDVGDEVKKGDLLADIDATVYAAKVDATRAQLRNQKAQLLDKQAQLQLAEIQYKRQKNLQQEDATTAESLEVTEASLKSARAQLNSLQAQIEQTDSTARVEAANLTYARIYAPMDGTIVSITSRQGQTLNTNQMAPTIMRVADLSTMTVQTQVSEADIGKLQLGMDVYFTTLGSQGRRWYSKLDRVQPTPEILNNVILYNALFDVPNENRVLMTQMSTQVFFIVSQAKNALLVPMSALQFGAPGEGRTGDKKPRGDNPGPAKKPAADTAASSPALEKTLASNSESRITGQGNRPRRARVKVMLENGSIEERNVLVGVTNRVQAQILEGLAEHEKIVIGETKTSDVNKSGQNAFGPGGPRMMR